MGYLEQTYAQTKAAEFLDGVRRNSRKSERIYAIGLTLFQKFLEHKYPDQNQKQALETIIEPLASNEINVYTLLDNFVSYILETKQLSPNSIYLYVAAVRSYLGYCDIDVAPSKFKRRVRLPKNHRQDEEPLDAADIRNILLSCNNRRLKAYLLVLASGGMRTIEALAIRMKDVDFSVTPTKVHIRPEYAKTRVGRDVYISDEATKFLKEWIDWKYRKRRPKQLTPQMLPDDIVFSKEKFGLREARNKPAEEQMKDQPNPEMIYLNVGAEFNSLLKTLQMDERKEGMLRRKITMNSLRRHAKTVISNVVSQDYSEWFLGHSKSRYWTMKEKDRRSIYAEKCMKYLTFLDYSNLEATEKNIEAKLEEKDREIAYLRERYNESTQSVSLLSDKLTLQSERLSRLERRFKK